MAVLGCIRAHANSVARAQYGQLTGADRAPLTSNEALTAQDVNQCVEVAPPGNVYFSAGLQRGMQDGDRRVGHARAGVTIYFAGNDAQQRTAVRRSQQ